MQITFTGPDGQPVTVADPRLARAARGVTVTLPQDRRPAGWLITAMKV